MILQNKFLYLILLLLCQSLVSSQVVGSDQGTSESDSLHQAYMLQLNRKLYLLENRLLQIIESQQAVIDSLTVRMTALEEEADGLRATGNKMDVRIEEAWKQTVMNKHLLSFEKERFRRILLIAGPSLLGLILISTVLFFVLIMRQSDQTNRKIMALRRYTYNEVKESRSEILKSFKKRLREFRDQIGKGQKKQTKKNQKEKKIARAKNKRG
jgi:hypothetical protein